MKPRLFGSIDDFRQALKVAGDGGENIGDDATVRASFDTEVKVADDEHSRSLTFTISTAAVDRMGDSIVIDGWELENYRKNPVVLADHDASVRSVLGKTSAIWIESAKLKATMEFLPRDNAASGRIAEGVLQMYRGGFLSATSVGFIPRKYAFTTDPARKFGIDFLSQELLEFSLVAVPANPEALLEGRKSGIDIAPMLDHYAAALERCADNGRIIKLAETVLGGKGDDLVTLSWAERILATSGKQIVPAGHVVITPERAKKIAEMEAAATRDRLAKKRARELDVIRARG